MRTIDYTKSYKQIQSEETEFYRKHLLNNGMEEITKDCLLTMLDELNYRIDKSMCNSYYNNLNELNYLALSMSYTDKETGLSFAHYTQSYSNHENLEKLQKIRRNYFVFDKGRIWDL